MFKSSKSIAGTSLWISWSHLTCMISLGSNSMNWCFSGEQYLYRLADSFLVLSLPKDIAFFKWLVGVLLLTVKLLFLEEVGVSTLVEPVPSFKPLLGTITGEPFFPEVSDEPLTGLLLDLVLISLSKLICLIIGSLLKIELMFNLQFSVRLLNLIHTYF